MHCAVLMSVGAVAYFTHTPIPMVKFMENGEQSKMKKILNYFELNRIYRFDVTDITALIYVLCAVLVMCDINATIPFFIGATIATAFCWQARRVNLVVLNAALWVMNAYNLILMIWG